MAGILDNRALGAHLMIVELQQRAVAVDAADPQNAEIQTELGNKVERRFANDAAVTAAKFAARENNAKIFFHHQRVRHVEVVGHDTQIAVAEQRVRHGLWRGPDINKQR